MKKICSHKKKFSSTISANIMLSTRIFLLYQKKLQLCLVLRILCCCFLFTAHQGLGTGTVLLITVLDMYCTLHDIHGAICRSSDALWGGPAGPRYEPRTDDLEAGTLTTRPPHLFENKQMNKYLLPTWRKGFRSASVGRTFSLADRETKNAKGTNHWQMVKYAIT